MHTNFVAGLSLPDMETYLVWTKILSKMILKQFPTDLLGLLNMYLVILAVPYPRTRTWGYLDVSWYVMMVFAMYKYVSMGSMVGTWQVRIWTGGVLVFEVCRAALAWATATQMNSPTNTSFSPYIHFQRSHVMWNIVFLGIFGSFKMSRTEWSSPNKGDNV